MKMKKFLILFLVGVGLSLTAQAKDAKCKITLNNQVIVNNTCSFSPIDGDGSFVLSGKYGLYQDIQAFKVVLMDKGTAKTYARGENDDWNEWGRVVRSKSQPACWNGKMRSTRYQICAFAK